MIIGNYPALLPIFIVDAGWLVIRVAGVVGANRARHLWKVLYKSFLCGKE